TDEDLLAVHTERHVEMLGQLSRRGGGWIDADTVVSPASDEVARLAAGGALAALDAVISPEPSRPTSAFVLARPPGHHAMAERAMGFCLYNSVAVAARYPQRRDRLRPGLVPDSGVHRGNASRAVCSEDPSVSFISLTA